MAAPSASISRRRSTAPAGSGPLRTRSSATATKSGFSGRMALRTAASATALPWTSERTIARVIEPPRDKPPSSPQHPLARDDERQGGFTRRLAVDGRDAARPAEPATELVHRDLETESVAGHDDALEATVVDPREQADPVAEPWLLGDVDAHG